MDRIAAEQRRPRVRCDLHAHVAVPEADPRIDAAQVHLQIEVGPLRGSRNYPALAQDDDIDRFREQVFKEKLYEMVDQPSIDQDALKTDDFALLDFAFTWLKTVARLK